MEKKIKMVNLIADGILSKITEINASLNAFDSGWVVLNFFF